MFGVISTEPDETARIAVMSIWGAMFFIGLSRIAMGTNSVLNRTILLTCVPDGLRGRVFTSVDALLHASMMLSMGLAGIASMTYTPRQIGVVAGLLSGVLLPK